MEKALNPQQEKAVKHVSGPLLIIAGAGTGKTTVITERIKWLIQEKKIKPENILALTFTEKAAAEMEERVDVALPIGYTQTWILTFHGFCERVLRAECLHIGLDPSFKIMTEAEAQIFLKKHIFEFDLKYFLPKGNPNKFLAGMIQHFSRLKDEDISPFQYQTWIDNKSKDKDSNISSEDLEKYQELSRAYIKYEELKVVNSVMDFSDLIMYTVKLFRDRANVLNEYQTRFPYVLIDEFQDTNYTQNQLAIMLAGESQNITAVADDDQSIYRWRGAAVYNVLDFQNHFPNTKIVTLTKNYRSQQKILDSAYQLVQNNNPDRLEIKASIDKKLTAEVKKHKTQIGLISEETVEDEAEAVAVQIENLKPKQFSDIAILVRANSHAEPFTRALARHGIPYQFLGPGRLFKQEEVKDLISYLKILANINDSHAMYRVLAMSGFNLTGRDLQWLLSYAKKHNRTLFEMLETFVKDPTEFDHSMSEFTLNQMTKIIEMIHRHMDKIATSGPGEILYYFLQDTGELLKMRDPNSPEEVRKVENISSFFTKIKEYEVQNSESRVGDFVEYLDFLIESGESPLASQIDWRNENAVNILTIHSAKGLEFETVFLVNLVAQRFPSTDRKEQIPLPEELVKEPLPTIDPHIAEERRLFYVGITRAKTNLFLTSAKFYHDAAASRPKKLSLFIQEALGEKFGKYSIEKSSTSKNEFSFDHYKKDQVKVDTLPLIPKHKVTYLSYSQIECFDTCPMHYKLDYILQIPRLPSVALTFGTTIHDTLRDTYMLIKNHEIEKDVDNVYQKALEFYELHWSSIGFENKKQEHDRYADGQRILKDLLEADLKRNFEIQKLEEPFTFAIAPNLKIGGRIDRIDKHPDGKIEIIDYKTGTKPELKDLETGLKGLQLSMYAMAAMKILDTPLENLILTFYYLESNERISITRTHEDLATAKQKILEVRDAIEKSNFTCSGNYFCQNNCDYKLFCS